MVIFWRRFWRVFFRKFNSLAYWIFIWILLSSATPAVWVYWTWILSVGRAGSSCIYITHAHLVMKRNVLDFCWSSRGGGARGGAGQHAPPPTAAQPPPTSSYHRLRHLAITENPRLKSGAVGSVLKARMVPGSLNFFPNPGAARDAPRTSREPGSHFRTRLYIRGSIAKNMSSPCPYSERAPAN